MRIRDFVPTVVALLALLVVVSLVGCSDDSAASGPGGSDVVDDTDNRGRDLSGLGADGDAADDDAAEDADLANDDATESDTSEPPDASLDEGVGDDAASADMIADDSGASEDLGADVASTAVQTLELTLKSEGGFAGLGHRDYVYVDGTLSMHYPFTTPTDCSGDLTAAQIVALHNAVTVVEWNALEADYYPPENPTCCCDQFLWEIAVDIVFVNDDPALTTVDWCDQSRGEELLPTDLVALVELLDGWGTEILDACTTE